MDNMKTQENKIQNEKNSLEHKGGSYDERERVVWHGFITLRGDRAVTSLVRKSELI